MAVETSEEEITKVWHGKKTVVGLTTVSKLDSVLYELGRGKFVLKLTEKETEISNRAGFFDWKCRSGLKDLPIFSHQDWPSEKLAVFASYMHLGDYDTLLITETGSNKLNFMFEKENGISLRWVLKYKDPHQLPVGQKIPLERFLFNNVEGYTRADGKSGSIIRLLMNNEVYELKVEDLEVYCKDVAAFPCRSKTNRHTCQPGLEFFFKNEKSNGWPHTNKSDSFMATC